MDVLMPQLGETVAEGKIIKWFKSVGDVVAAGDILFEIETDKTSMEVPAMFGGALSEIRVKEGETVLVSAVVAVIAGDGPAAAPAPAAAAPAASAPAAAPAPAAPVAAPAAAQPVKREVDPFNAVVSPEKNFGKATLPNGAKTTPLARRLAAQAGVDLSKLKGSGPHGRIVAADIKSAPASAPAGGGSMAAGASLAQVKALYTDIPFEELELDGMRRTIAKRLVESKQTVPHFYLTAEVGLEALLDVRKRINASGEVKVSVNDFVVKAYALALKKVPDANAVWAEDRVLKFQRVDVGVAVAVEGGLFTPVIRDAASLSLSALSAEIRDLAERARTRKLKPNEYQGGAGAVSNLGMYGVREFSAIVNPPHATILAVGAGERRPVETEDGGVRFESRMTVTLSVDHRVVDGAVGAELLAAFKAVMENPLLALL